MERATPTRAEQFSRRAFLGGLGGLALAHASGAERWASAASAGRLPGAVGAAGSPTSAASGPGDPLPDGAARQSALAAILARDPRTLQRRADGTLETVFGLLPDEARQVFFPVSRARGLPNSYAPPDLGRQLGHPLRMVALADLSTMFAAADAAGAYPVVISGYRSFAEQTELFEAAVLRQQYRDEAIERAEAERRAARFVAPPGRSQHQLGTTADLSSWELGYGIGARFADTLAGRWLVEHAWEYGCIIPYTPAAEPRTGYVPEPWHLRWLGRPLAAFLWQADYLHALHPTADDWLLAVEELLDNEISPTA